MTREAVERELRERLEACRPYGGAAHLSAQVVEGLATDLLPWIMEMREDAAAQARIGDGQSP